MPLKCHGITCGDHRKLFKKIHSAFWTPTQAKVPKVGLKKVLKIKVRSHTASRNTCGGTWLLARISSAQFFHSPPQPSVHSFSFTSCNNSRGVFLDRASFSAAFSNSHAVFNISATALGIVFTRNLTISVLPSFFCWWAKACSSTSDFTFFSTMITVTSNVVRRFLFFHVLLYSLLIFN